MTNTVTQATPLAWTGSAMALCGFGIGLVMPVMLVVVQNAVEMRDLGAGSASVSFFRSIGGAIGVALFAALLMAAINAPLRELAGAALPGENPARILLHAGDAAVALAPALGAAVHTAILDAFHAVFRLGALIGVLAFVNTLFLREIPLRTTAGGADGAQRTQPRPAVGPAE